MAYPSGESLIYAPTVLNQVDTIYLNGEDFIDYGYDGRMLTARLTTTDAPGGATSYEHRVDYDVHRRRGVLANRLETPRASLPVVIYNLLRDLMGNLRSSTATEGIEKFVGDDRTYSVDRLNRLFETEYHETGDKETAALDRLGNRESFTDRGGQVTAYTRANQANEYATVGGETVAYDDAGNLSEDEAGRQYVYDEANRLIQVVAADETVLANYSYDALGRRISFEDPVAGVVTRYYYDGSRVIEERDGSDQRLRYHVHGAQYVDERVATFEDESRWRDDAGDESSNADHPTDASCTGDLADGSDDAGGVGTRGGGEFRYYLLGPNYSVVGYGNADGSVIERLDFTSSGDWVPGGEAAPGFYHDADADFDIDLADVASFAACFDPAGGQASPACLAAHDYDSAGVSDGNVDLDDFTALTGCYAGPYVTPGQDCARPSRSRAPPESGTYALHGRPVDVLSDGLVLVDFRARTYLPQHARFLQRDPTGYADGNNLYEAFGSNPLTFLDPLGTDIWTSDTDVAAWVVSRLRESIPHRPVAFTEHNTRALLPIPYDPAPVLPAERYQLSLSLSADEIDLLFYNQDWPFDPSASPLEDWRVLAWAAALEDPVLFDLMGRDLFSALEWRDTKEFFGVVFSEQVMSRVSGVGRLAGGTAVFATGWGAAGLSLGWATPVALLGTAWAGDQFGTGLGEIWYGVYGDSLGGQAIQYTLGEGTLGQAGALVYDVGPDLAAAVAAPRVFGRAGVVAVPERPSLTGQQHHAISKKVWRDLQRNPNLRGKYQLRDPRFATRARNLEAHRGYQKWHRELDDEVAEWVRRRPDVTQEEFERWLRNRYSKPDIRDRFPNGLP